VDDRRGARTSAGLAAFAPVRNRARVRRGTCAAGVAASRERCALARTRSGLPVPQDAVDYLGPVEEFIESEARR